ncbi:hypothetical protein [Salipiger bermudensis]|uniref:Uncharacterized protein n=1 Tax=Salipiger bermudensis (strain DSM 26914 / JCM 13377 / KCTC 12554 / HTCC2601) TaxID=314265 RepID=Q0FLJ8_SALBH|nr:hypothetical protein [Salipiger bermudensis]EAU45100.1 hypothetical protein R2601_22976 [Salipiger bermudensis HTCC2601]
MTTAFEAGKTYWTRSICDHDTIFQITVERRTAKTIVTTEGKRLRISLYQGVEQVAPHGRYSMCAIIGADRFLEEEAPRDTWAEANAAQAARQEVQDATATAQAPEASNVIDFAAYRARRVA